MQYCFRMIEHIKEPHQVTPCHPPPSISLFPAPPLLPLLCPLPFLPPFLPLLDQLENYARSSLHLSPMRDLVALILESFSFSSSVYSLILVEHMC